MRFEELLKKYYIKLTLNSLHRNVDDKKINCNDIARITIKLSQPLLVDKYNDNRSTGSLIIIDENTNNTVGAGMII